MEFTALRSSISHNFSFRCGEVLLYNWGTIVYGGSSHLHSLVVFATWQRIFLGLSSPARLVLDSAVPAFTAAWFSGAAVVRLKRLWLRCTALTAFGCAAFVPASGVILHYLAKGQTFDLEIFLLACAVWSIANTAQHLAGTYLLAISEGTRRLAAGTIVFLALGAAATAAACNLHPMVRLDRTEALLAIQGLIYVGYALTQLGLLRSILHARQGCCR
jgi:hypothetical protein